MSQTYKLLLRQLRDIQAQADKIASGENDQDSIETFAKYSLELKEYVLKHVDSDEIRGYASIIPDVNYERVMVSWWQFIIMPAWWISLYNDYKARERAVEDIVTVKGKYATLELMIRGLAD